MKEIMKLIIIREKRQRYEKHYSANRNSFQVRKPKEFCTYWNRGYCKFGDECFKAHVESPYCFFQERCKRRDTCQFFHANVANNFLYRRGNIRYHR